MTETAGTLCAAAEILKAGGAKRIFAAVSHAVIGDLGHQRIEESVIEEVITTDSTPVEAIGKVKPVSIAPILGEAIHRIHIGKSVTSLFDIDGPSE
jgi:ribose-phosphate pyrophosphokinase